MMSKGSDAQQIPETPEERELAKIAMERWQEYKQYFIPVENKYMNVVSNIGEGEKQKVAASAIGNVQSRLGASLQGARANLYSRGINPNSGAALTIEQSAGKAGARARGLGGSAGRSAVESQRMLGLEKIVNMGTGVKNAAQIGFSGLAQSAAQRALADTGMAVADANARRALYGNLIGLGLGGIYKKKGGGYGWGYGFGG